MVKNLYASAGDLMRRGLDPWGPDDLLEEGVVTHSSILAWTIPMDKRSLAGRSPWGPERVRHD